VVVHFRNAEHSKSLDEIRTAIYDDRRDFEVIHAVVVENLQETLPEMTLKNTIGEEHTGCSALNIFILLCLPMLQPTKSSLSEYIGDSLPELHQMTPLSSNFFKNFITESSS